MGRKIYASYIPRDFSENSRIFPTGRRSRRVNYPGIMNSRFGRDTGREPRGGSVTDHRPRISRFTGMAPIFLAESQPHFASRLPTDARHTFVTEILRRWSNGAALPLTWPEVSVDAGYCAAPLSVAFAANDRPSTGPVAKCF